MHSISLSGLMGSNMLLERQAPFYGQKRLVSGQRASTNQLSKGSFPVVISVPCSGTVNQAMPATFLSVPKALSGPSIGPKTTPMAK